MRTAILVGLMLLAAPSLAQVKAVLTSADSLTATTAWTVFTKTNDYETIRGFAVDNDGLTGNLWVAFGDDSLAGSRMVIKPSEGMSWTGLSVMKLRIRASVGTVAYRLRYW